MITYKPKITFLDFLKEIPSSTLKVASSLAEFGKGIQEEIAKSGASVGLTLTAPFTGVREIKSEDLPFVQKQFKEFVFGKSPLKAIETRIAESEVKLKKEKGITLPTGKVVGTEFIKGKELGLSILGVGATIGLDFTGWGGGKKQVVKVLSKVNKVDDVAKILKGINVADDLIPVYSKTIAKLTKTDDVAKVLDKIVDIQKTTKAVRGGGEVVEAVKRAPKKRQFLTSVSQARPDIPLKTGGQYIPRSTDALAIRAKNLIKENLEAAETLARIKTDDYAVATASELIKHYSDEALKATNQAAKNLFYDKASDIAHLTAKNLTEQGRAIQSASIMGRLTPEGMLRFATKEINTYNELVLKSKGLFGLKKTIPKLTAQQTEMILKEFRNIEAMTDGTKKAMAFKRLSDTIADLIPSSMYQKIIAVWKAGLLTGIKTSGLNTYSNLFHGVSETIKDVPAAAIDSVASLFTGKRTLAITAKKTPGGFIEGFKKGWRYLTTGFDERNVGAKLDWKRVNFGKSKLAKGIQRYEETIFHILGAEDQPFYYGAKARSLASQAIAKARNKGLRGTKATSFIDDLIKSPTDEMLKYAANDAEIAVFQNQTMLGKIAKAIQKAPGGEIAVPFGRTPAAVANQLINYSPVGIVKTIVANIGKGKFDQRLFSQGIGRGITGSGIMYIGAELFKKGLITLDYPQGERERELWKIEGRKANSIKIGNKYRNVNVLGPAGFVLLTGAGYQKSLEENGSISRGLVDATAIGVASLSEQAFLRGVNQITEALNDPDRFFEGWFSNTMSSVIPTLIKDIGEAFDPTQRRAPGVLARFKSKIPGLRQTLEPQVSVLGEQRPRAGTWLETMIDPSRPSMSLDTNVVQELRRITDAGYKVSPTLLGDKEGYKNLTPEENTALWEATGEKMNSKLNNLFNFEKYKSLADDEKAKIIEDIIERSKIWARTQAVMDITEGLVGQELRDKLSELKNGGLMSRDVFNKFLSLQ